MDRSDVTFDSEPEASTAHDLLQKSQAGLSAGELAELNRLLGEHRANPAFAVTLMRELGPKELVNRSVNAALTDGISDEAVRSFLKHLGQTLATATRANAILARGFGEWIAEHVGKETVRIDSDYGDDHLLVTDYAVAPLLEHGEYAPEFLVPVAESLMVHNDMPGHSGLAAAETDPDGSTHFNPFGAALTALGNSPRASAEFFDRTG